MTFCSSEVKIREQETLGVFLSFTWQVWEKEVCFSERCWRTSRSSRRETMIKRYTNTGWSASAVGAAIHWMVERVSRGRWLWEPGEEEVLGQRRQQSGWAWRVRNAPTWDSQASLACVSIWGSWEESGRCWLLLEMLDPTLLSSQYIKTWKGVWNMCQEMIDLSSLSFVLWFFWVVFLGFGLLF